VYRVVILLSLWRRFVDVPGYHIVGQVPVVTWEPQKRFAREIAAERKPVIIRNSIVKTWPALKEWNPEYLSEHVETLLGVYQHRNKTFTFYDDSKPYSTYDGVRLDLEAAHKIVIPFFLSFLR